MSTPVRAVLAVSALVIVAACAPRPEPMPIEPAPPMAQPAAPSPKWR